MQVGQELLGDEQGGSHEAGALQLVLQAHQEAHVQQQRLGRLRRGQGCATLHEPHQASHQDVGQAALLLCLHPRARWGALGAAQPSGSCEAGMLGWDGPET